MHDTQSYIGDDARISRANTCLRHLGPRWHYQQMIGSSARHPRTVVQRRGAVMVAAVLVLCFTTALLADRPMAENAAPMAALQSAAHEVGHRADGVRVVVQMGAMLCPDDILGTQAGGVSQPLPAVIWSVVTVALVVVTWLGSGLPSRHARAPGPTRQALLQRFQL